MKKLTKREQQYAKLSKQYREKWLKEDENVPTKLIPYRTQAQSRKYNKELKRIRTFGYP